MQLIRFASINICRLDCSFVGLFTISFGFNLFWHYLAPHFNRLLDIVSIRFTYEGSRHADMVNIVNFVRF